MVYRPIVGFTIPFQATFLAVMIAQYRGTCFSPDTVIYGFRYCLTEQNKEPPRLLPKIVLVRGSEPFKGFFELAVYEVCVDLGG
jgi:hypothetical protein